MIKKEELQRIELNCKYDINPSISTIIFNVDGPTTPIKKQTVKVDKKGDPIICCPQKTHFQYRHRQIKNKGIEKDKPG